MLRPFSGEAKLMLNKNPGEDMNVPKVLYKVAYLRATHAHTRARARMQAYTDVQELLQ